MGAALATGRGRAGRLLRAVPGLQIEHRPDPAVPAVKVITSHLDCGEVVAAGQLAAHALKRRPGHRQLTDLHIAALRHTGEPERALDLCVTNARARIRWLDRNRIRWRSPRRITPAGRIFIAGFYKSGSSAVFDYLRGLPGVARWSVSGEMRLIKSVGGIADLAMRQQRQGTLLPADLVDLYLHLTGWQVPTTRPGRYDRRRVVNRNSAALFRNRLAYGYLAACLTGFLQLVELTRQGPLTAAELTDHFQDLVGAALDAAARDSGRDVLVIDQAINAWRLWASRFVPPSTFVVVHRDPRDQFVDTQTALEQHRGTSRSVESFATTYRRNRLRAERDLGNPGQQHGHQFVSLAFEDFVLDHADQAAGLLGRLGLAGRAHRPGHYEPTRARAAVGRHVGSISPAELATLTEDLSEYFDKRVGPW